MTAALWLGTYLLHSTVLCGAVLLFRRTLRRLDGSEYVWRAAMLLPLVSATIAQVWGLGPWEIVVAGGQSMASPSVSSEPAAAAASWPAVDIARAAAVACFSIGALLTCRDWIAHVLFVRSLGLRTPSDAEVVGQVADLLRRSGHHPIILTCAPGAASPMVIGRREICLPVRAAHDLTHGQLRALVAHEVAHVIRGDRFWFAAMAYLESALFVQPLNRLGRRELRHLAELSCDEWAARRVSDPMAVAHCLVEVAGWSRRSAAATVPAAANSGNGLTERIQRLIEPRVSPVRLALSPCLVVLALASLGLPGLAITSQISGGPSADYLRGYELGREYAARHGARPADRDPAGTESEFRQREELERRLVDAKSKTR
ncbi:MAG TPA: M56 family metallopeptidase [Vicinamibacterales bacterium]|nr:M56 family metallopeptidase [Vicinamibacterales bacterium]